MATKNITPRADGEGSIGTAVKNWLKGFFKTIFLGTGGIVDSNSNEVLKPESVADAINEITIKNAAAGNAPESKATGDDTNIDYIIRVKGTGAFQVMDGSGNILATFDKVASAVNYITLLNSATGDTLEVKAVGTDTDIHITLVPKGSGKSKTPDGEIIVKTAPAMTAGKMVKSNADGVVEDGTNTDTDVADAVTKKHSKDADADLDSTFEATFVKKVDTVNVLSDITSSGADIEDAVTKKHSQNTDTGSNSDPFTLTGKFKKSTQVGITAHAGGGQGDAIVITKDIVEISICATGGDSVKLPAAAAGLQILVINHGEAAADVFPNTDDAINEEAVNTAKSLAVNTTMLCSAYDDTNWECVLLTRV